MKSVVRPLIQPKLKLKIRPFPTLFELDFFFPCRGPPKKKKNKKKDFQCAFYQYLSILIINYCDTTGPFLAISMLKVQELQT